MPEDVTILKGGDIKETIETGHVPTTTGKDLGFPVTSHVKADPSKEYYAGAPYLVINYPRPLPHAIDDVTRDFGPDTYQRMLHDPVCYAEFNGWRLATVSQAWHLIPCRSERDPDYDQANAVLKFWQRQLERIDWYGITWQMLEAMPFGNKIGEKVFCYDYDPAVRVGQAILLEDVAVKDQKSVSIVADAYLRTIGYLGVIPGQGSPIYSYSTMGDLSLLPNFLAPWKAMRLTFSPRNRDPRGQSSHRPAYTPWYYKTLITPEWIKFLGQLAVPSLIAIMPEGAHTQAVFDTTGAQQFDTLGQPVTLTPEQAAVNVLQAIKNGSVGALPNGTTLQVIQANGSGEAFANALREYFNMEIRTAITGQTLASGEAIHQARASSETHQDRQQMNYTYSRTIVEKLWIDTLKQVTLWNLGQQALQYCPRFSLTDTEQTDRATWGTTISQLAKVGYLDPSQYEQIDADLGLPMRAEGWQERQEEQDRQQAQQQQAANGEGDNGEDGSE